jgi:glyoxylase-like metal-dependent hydrolase (beta-lactamase superfamily II)
MPQPEIKNSLCLLPKAPDSGGYLDLHPGIRWIRLPLPFELNHINVWLLQDQDGWTLVDTGLNADIVREAWESLFLSALDGKAIRRIIITHYHPDHMGLAKFLCDKFKPELLMTAETEANTRFLLRGADAGEVGAIQAFCRVHGIDRVEQYTDFVTGARYRKIISGLPEAVSRINADTVLHIGGDDWRPIIANGHAPGHASLYSAGRGLLIAGDQVLPGISPNISVTATNRDEDALRAYLHSMQRFTGLDSDTTVLPSHGKVFTGLHARVNAIVAHHHERLDLVLALCEEPLSLTEVAQGMFRKDLDGANYVLALGEALSHLMYLHNRGELEIFADNGARRFVRQ